MNTLTKCNATVSAAVSSWVKAKSAKLASDVKAVDLMFAEGVNPNHLEAPEKGQDRTAFESYKAAVVSGFPANMAKLATAPDAVAKAYSDQQKSDRRYWKQRIGSDMRDLKAALIRRYEAERVANLPPEQAEAEAAEKAKNSTLEAKFASSMADWAKRLQKAEKCGFSVDEAVKLLKQLQALATQQVSKAK